MNVRQLIVKIIFVTISFGLAVYGERFQQIPLPLVTSILFLGFVFWDELCLLFKSLKNRLTMSCREKSI
jgi:hypothetical protein